MSTKKVAAMSRSLGRSTNVELMDKLTVIKRVITNYYYEAIMNSDSAYSDYNSSVTNSPAFQTIWLPPPVHLTSNHRQASQVSALPMLPSPGASPEDRHGQCPEGLGHFFTGLVRIDEIAQKMTAMSPQEIRTFLTHGDPHVDEQVLNTLFDIMQGIENRFFNLRTLIFPFALATPEETNPTPERTISAYESSDDNNDDLPATLAAAPCTSPTTNNTTGNACHPVTDITSGIVQLESTKLPAGAVLVPCKQCRENSEARRQDNETRRQDNNADTSTDRDNQPSAASVNEPAPAHVRRPQPANRKLSPLNRELHIPESLSLVLDATISGIASQRDRLGHQEDIISCYNGLTTSQSGQEIKEFLQAVLLQGTEAQACAALSALQQRTDLDEQPITITQLRDLQHYLASQVFNGKKVNFTLSDMTHLLSLHATPTFISQLPPSLAQLVSYLVETTLVLRTKEGVALKKRVFLNHVQQCDRSKLLVELLGALATTAPNYEIIQKVQTEINAANEGHPDDPAVTAALIDKLKNYLDEHFFDAWLFAFDVAELSTDADKAAPRKATGKVQQRRMTARTGYYFDPPYNKHRKWSRH